MTYRKSDSVRGWFLTDISIFYDSQVSSGEDLTFFCSYSQCLMIHDPLKRIEELALPLVKQEDLFLVDIELKQQDMNVVWVYVDSEEGGVNLDVCSKISRELSFQVENEDIFPKSYRLNVSSPGLSRPLSDKRQYGKNIGRTVKVKYKQDGEYEKIEGILKEVADSFVTIENEGGHSESINFDDLVETKIVPKI